MLKTIGYSISSLSVILLGIVSWGGASDKPLLLVCLVLGMLASLVGMACRWISYLREQAEKRREHQPEPRLPARQADGGTRASGPRGLDRPAAGAPGADAGGRTRQA